MYNLLFIMLLCIINEKACQVGRHSIPLFGEELENARLDSLREQVFSAVFESSICDGGAPA